MASAARIQVYDNEGEAVSVASESSTNQFVTFTCGERVFGIDIMRVREIRSRSPITQVPSQPFGAQGVLDIRGKIVRIYDLIQLVGGDNFHEQKNDTVILVVSLATQDVGLLVDTVSDIIFAKGDDLRPMPGPRGADTVVHGLVRHEDRLVTILNPAALLPGEGADENTAYV